jgi:hypothetical protein
LNSKTVAEGRRGLALPTRLIAWARFGKIPCVDGGFPDHQCRERVR